MPKIERNQPKGIKIGVSNELQKQFKTKTMKAKKQKLVKSVIKWIGEQCEMGWNKEEIQDLLDEFIDHHDRKKKSKFGSDKEQVKLKEEPKEKTFEEWKEIFPIGSKARAKNDHGEYVKKGEIIEIEDYYNVPHDKVNNFIAVVFKKFFLCPIDNLEPIIETKFKVGDKVEIYYHKVKKGTVGVIDKIDNSKLPYRTEFLTEKGKKDWYWFNETHLKLLPND